MISPSGGLVMTTGMSSQVSTTSRPVTRNQVKTAMTTARRMVCQFFAMLPSQGIPQDAA